MASSDDLRDKKSSGGLLIERPPTGGTLRSAALIITEK